MPFDTAALFVEHRGSLVNYATSLVGSRAKAEDLVQEAWMRLDQAVGEHSVREPLAYLYRIVRNLALDDQRASARQRHWEAEDASASAVLGLRPPDTPEDVALHKAEMRLLRRALAELPQRTRIAFGMHRLGGYKLREIAAHLGISIPLAQALVADALEHCKQRLGWS